MERPLNSYLRLYTLRRSQLKNAARHESLKYSIRRLSVLLLILVLLFILFLYRPLEDIIHDIGDANTILEPILFLILFIIFLFYLQHKKK